MFLLLSIFNIITDRESPPILTTSPTLKLPRHGFRVLAFISSKETSLSKKINPTKPLPQPKGPPFQQYVF